VCSTWFGHRTTLLNSSSSAISHSSSNVGRSGEKYPSRRARSMTELMRWRSEVLVRPRHVQASYVRRATTVARVDELQSRVAQTVTAQHSKRVICLSTGRHQLLNVLSDGEVVCKDHAQHRQFAEAHDATQLSRLGSMTSPLSTSPRPAMCKKTTSHDLSQFNCRLFRLANSVCWRARCSEARNWWKRVLT